MRLGFVGTGTITRAIVTGLCTAPGAPEQIWVSPRNAQTAASLASTYPSVRVAAANQQLLDEVDTVILAVRPQVALEVLEPLVFQAHQRIVSLIASLSLEQLATLVAPASSVTLAAPLPAVASHLGPTAIFPPDAATATLFARISAVVPVPLRSQFDALMSCTAQMSSYFALLQLCADFLSQQGVPEGVARQYVAALFHALGHTALTDTDHSFQQLSLEHQTRGGLNEQFAAELAAAGVFQSHATGLQHILRRIQGLKPASK